MRTPRLRLLSALLAVVLFFTLLPVSALAEDGAVTLEGLRAADAAARAHVKEHIS